MATIPQSGSSTTVAASTSAQVLDPAAGNAQKRRPERVDGLEHLRKEDDKVLTHTEHLRTIAMYDLWLKITGIEVLHHAWDPKYKGYFNPDSFWREVDLVRRGDYGLRAEENFPEEHKNTGLQEFRRKRIFQGRMKAWSVEKLEASIFDDTGAEFGTLMDRQLTMAIVSIRSHEESSEPYLGALRSLLRLFENYRDAIRNAASGKYLTHLTEKQLDQLKDRLDGVEERFDEACEVCAYKPRATHLINVNSKEWWNPPRNTPKDDSVPSASAATAFPKFPTAMQSSLVAIVPVVCVLSAVPAALAWKNGSNMRGATTDADFYQAIAGAMMQLLGLVTFVWPTLSHPRLCSMAWFWIWILAAFSALCAILSIPLFLTVSSTCCFVVGFIGVLAQAIVQLQVITSV